jgi:hypothetical protein
MGAIIDVKYFNSFWMKKIEGPSITSPVEVSNPTWPGMDWDPFGYPLYPNWGRKVEENWYIEEARIKGGFNNTMVSQGARAYFNEKDPTQDIREASLIYSGIYNSRTDINKTNVFSTTEPITKSLDPSNGSIQKLFAEDTNLIIFQENKVSQALIDKDAIYSAEGAGTPVSTTNLVIGQIVPYLGRYGIGKNPESFAQFGFRKYFIDPHRATVMRLSRDGLTEISQYGMKDYFRDTLTSLNNNLKEHSISWTFDGEFDNPTDTFNVSEVSGCEVLLGSKIITLEGSPLNINDTGAIVTNVVDLGTSPATYQITASFPITVTANGFFTYNYKSKLIGGWDNYTKQYTISLQGTPTYVSKTDNYATTAFDENINGWICFYNYKPSFIFSLKGIFYSTTDYSIYQHYLDTALGNNYNNFYGTRFGSNVSFIINDKPSIRKVYQTINYEGDNGWQLSTLRTDFTGLDSGVSYGDNAALIRSYDDGLYTNAQGYPQRAGFDRKENLYASPLIADNIYRPDEVLSSTLTSGVKGYYLVAAFSIDNSTDVGGNKEIWSVGTTYVRSS